MRLTKYLCESSKTLLKVEYKDMINLIKKDCKPFLYNWNKNYNKNFLYSGRHLTHGSFYVSKVRQDRYPKDTPLELHNFIDNWFYKKFGIKARSNAIFCSFDINSTKSYGNPYIIFPIGEYTTIASPIIKDLYDEIDNATYLMPSRNGDNTGLENWNNYTDETTNDKIIDATLDILNKGKYTKNIYSSSAYEIMLHCKEYYMMKADKFLIKSIEIDLGEGSMKFKKYLSETTAISNNNVEVNFNVSMRNGRNFKTNIPPAKRTLDNIPRYANKKLKCAFQDWLCIKKDESDSDITAYGKAANGKWYGWSHRAVFGFEPGYEIKEGGVAIDKNRKLPYKIKDEEDAKWHAILFAKEVA